MSNDAPGGSAININEIDGSICLGLSLDWAYGTAAKVSQIELGNGRCGFEHVGSSIKMDRADLDAVRPS